MKGHPFLLRFSVAEVIIFVTALLISAAMVYMVVANIDARKRAEGRSALQNCGQIETVKREIRKTVAVSLQRLPSLDYYRTRPEELARAERDTRKSIANFAPLDCYALPVVRDAGLKGH